MSTTDRRGSRGLGTEMARAIGWLVLRAGVSKLPEVASKTIGAEPTKERGGSAELPRLVKIAASIVGVILALVPRPPIVVRDATQ